MHFLIKIKNIIFILFLLRCFKFNCVHGARFRSMTHMNKITLIISMDGFDYRFLKRSDIPHIKHIHYAGTSAMIPPQRPNVGLSNHQTMVTGVYMMDHMVFNYNQKLGNNKNIKYSQEFYAIPKTAGGWGNLALPIWVVNQLAGGTTLCLNWPGAEFNYYDIQNSECEIIPPKFKHKEHPTIKEKLAMLSEHLSRKDRPNLVLVYFDEPDTMLHVTGNSSNVTNSLVQLDKFVAGVLGLKFDLGLEKRLNIIQVSDHGFVEILRGDYLQFAKIIKRPIEKGNYIENSSTNPIVSQFINREDTNKFWDCPNYKTRYEIAVIMNQTKKFIMITVDDKIKDMPKIAPDDFSCALISPMPNATFNIFKQITEDYERDYKITYNEKSVFGVHGYEKEGYRTRAIFSAYGRTFNKHVFLKQVEQVDYYPLILKCIGLKASHPIRGIFENVEPALRKPSVVPNKKVDWKKLYFTAALSSLIFTTLFNYTIVMYRSIYVSSKKKNV